MLIYCLVILFFCKPGSCELLGDSIAGLYADNGIDQTILYASIPKRERKELQEEILSLLGLHARPRPPNHETSQSAPKFMLDLYESFVDEESGDVKIDGEKLQSKVREPGLKDNNITLSSMNDADVIMSFVNHARKQRHHLRHDRQRRFLFDLSEVPAEHMVIGAELRLFKAYSWKQPWFQNFTISVYLVKRGADPEDREIELLDEQMTYTIFKGWIVFNVTRAVESWIGSPSSNFGLFIDIQSGTNEALEPADISLAGRDDPDDKEGFMVAFFKQRHEDTVMRSKRSPTERRKKKPEQSSRKDFDHRLSSSLHFPFAGYDAGFSSRSCQKRTLYVSFRLLGWQDWIIAPDGYPAYFCHGECSFPLNAHMNATNHAIVQALVHLFNPHIVPKALCAPTKLSPISVLYYDENSNVVLKKYRNMVARGCGCH